MGTGFCSMCNETLEDGSPGRLLAHLQIMHPDLQWECWPDGTVVIEDTTISIEDFLDE